MSSLGFVIRGQMGLNKYPRPKQVEQRSCFKWSLRERMQMK